MKEEKESKVIRLKSIDVETPMGPRKINMVPIMIDPSNPIEETLCASKCPYGNICEKLRDPRNPSDPNRTLQDWCVEISFNDENLDTVNELGSMVPAEGSIETLYDTESDPFKQLMELNPMVNLNTFIDQVCSGFCSMYNKEHSNCNIKNDFCICKGLFVRTMKSSVLNEKPVETELTNDTENETTSN